MFGRYPEKGSGFIHWFIFYNIEFMNVNISAVAFCEEPQQMPQFLKEE